MKSFFSAFGNTLHDLFTSKKFLVAAGSAVTAIANGVSPGHAVLVAGGAYIGAQGLADFGKHAAGVA